MMQSAQHWGTHLVQEQADDLLKPTIDSLANFPSMRSLNEALPLPAKSTEKKKKQVTFSVIQIQEHKVILRDSPNCRLPLAIDWKHTKRILVMDVEHFEQRKQRHGHRPGKKTNKMYIDLRRNRLKKMGYSDQIFRQAAERRFSTKRRSEAYREEKFDTEARGFDTRSVVGND